jgi:hypothetical protein
MLLECEWTAPQYQHRQATGRDTRHCPKGQLRRNLVAKRGFILEKLSGMSLGERMHNY